MSLWQDFLTHDGQIAHKWVHYFAVYERHFERYRNHSVTLLEIGVGKGGSLELWQGYLGPLARIVGIDIEPACKACERPGIDVRIGSQSDVEFLARIIDEFGVPDIVIDDGSHRMDDIAATFAYLYPLLGKNATYLVEDLHTAYREEYGGGLERPGTFIEFTKQCIDRLNADHSRGAIAPDCFTRDTFGIHIYDSIVCFEKGDVWRKVAPMTGRREPAGQS